MKRLIEGIHQASDDLTVVNTANSLHASVWGTQQYEVSKNKVFFVMLILLAQYFISFFIFFFIL